MGAVMSGDTARSPLPTESPHFNLPHLKFHLSFVPPDPGKHQRHNENLGKKFEICWKPALKKDIREYFQE